MVVVVLCIGVFVAVIFICELHCLLFTIKKYVMAVKIADIHLIFQII